MEVLSYKFLFSLFKHVLRAIWRLVVEIKSHEIRNDISKDKNVYTNILLWNGKKKYKTIFYQE